MGIPIVLVFSWIGFSLLMLKIRYLPALEWNIVSFQQKNLKRETNDTTPSCLKFSGDAVCGIRTLLRPKKT